MRYPRFIILISLFSAGLIGGIFTFPAYKNYLEKYQDLENKRTFLLNQAQYFQKIEKDLQRLNAKKEEVEKISSMLPDKFDTSSIVNYLNNLAQENGLIIKKTVIKPGSNLSKIKRIKGHQIFLELGGTYFSFKSFLEKLEKSARLFEVEKINFSLPRKEINIYDFTLQLTVYSY